MNLVEENFNCPELGHLVKKILCVSRPYESCKTCPQYGGETSPTQKNISLRVNTINKGEPYFSKEPSIEEVREMLGLSPHPTHQDHEKLSKKLGERLQPEHVDKIIETSREYLSIKDFLNQPTRFHHQWDAIKKVCKKAKELREAYQELNFSSRVKLGMDDSIMPFPKVIDNTKSRFVEIDGPPPDIGKFSTLVVLRCGEALDVVLEMILRKGHKVSEKPRPKGKRGGHKNDAVYWFLERIVPIFEEATSRRFSWNPSDRPFKFFSELLELVERDRKFSESALEDIIKTQLKTSQNPS